MSPNNGKNTNNTGQRSLIEVENNELLRESQVAMGTDAQTSYIEDVHGQSSSRQNGFWVPQGGLYVHGHCQRLTDTQRLSLLVPNVESLLDPRLAYNLGFLDHLQPNGTSLHTTSAASFENRLAEYLNQQGPGRTRESGEEQHLEAGNEQEREQDEEASSIDSEELRLELSIILHRSMSEPFSSSAHNADIRSSQSVNHLPQAEAPTSQGLSTPLQLQEHQSDSHERSRNSSRQAISRRRMDCSDLSELEVFPPTLDSYRRDRSRCLRRRIRPFHVYIDRSRNRRTNIGTVAGEHDDDKENMPPFFHHYRGP
ncbi:MAG: hypothetical protein Q9227_002932 [Pyrenula ochraceoflavens]